MVISKPVKAKLTLMLIIIFGSLLRFGNLNWDENQHLHPDERYISLVLTAVRLPSSVQEYFSLESPLSPFNTQYSSYIYGQLPLTAIKYLSVKLGFDSYDKAYILGRTVSAVIDTASILLVFVLGRWLFGVRPGLFGALAYALTPLAIQNSHFMTMESWLTFSWLAVLLTTLIITEKQMLKSAVVGVMLGASLAIKINAIFLLPLIAIFILLNESKKSFSHYFLLITFYSLLSIFSFRLFQPTIFSSASWLDWGLRPEFRRAFEFQQQAINGTIMFPPQWQWMGTTPITFLVKNLGLWGLGPAISVLLVIGMAASVYAIIKNRDIRLAFLLLFVMAVIGYNGIKFVKTMRYAVPLLGILAVFSGVGADWLTNKFKIAGRTLTIGLFIVAMFWAIMFTNIYRVPTTRIAASEWIYQNIPAGSRIMLEEWDDPLPLLLPDYVVNQYKTEMVGVYASDDEFKKKQINRWLNEFDWIVLSSPRAKGSIGRLPENFPLMANFYQGLENGTLGFVKVKEFTSYPMLSIYDLRFTIYDSSAEESFWVYDHPKVEIYSKF
ncbi:glycosyltransferase family 39 protein [Candidatus Collierbacteria bacterium]|nr:glycosyltransferase family 39 protein [Candidatus Collierbacteria bacterium]